jgi:hypothetical protein
MHVAEDLARRAFASGGEATRHRRAASIFVADEASGDHPGDSTLPVREVPVASTYTPEWRDDFGVSTLRRSCPPPGGWPTSGQDTVAVPGVVTVEYPVVANPRRVPIPRRAHQQRAVLRERQVAGGPARVGVRPRPEYVEVGRDRSAT